MHPFVYDTIREGTPPVTVLGGILRYYRAKRQAEGLMDLYAAADATGKIGAEIGCAMGESSEIAAQFLGQLYCIDPWASMKVNDPKVNDPKVSVAEAQFDVRMLRFPHVTKLKLKSHRAAPLFPDGLFYIVYIDGDHDYANVKRDILCWYPKVRKGGWIAGHDYDEREKHAGVFKAVNEVLGKPSRRFCDNSFLFQKTPKLDARVAAFCPDEVEP